MHEKKKKLSYSEVFNFQNLLYLMLWLIFAGDSSLSPSKVSTIYGVVGTIRLVAGIIFTYESKAHKISQKISVKLWMIDNKVMSVERGLIKKLSTRFNEKCGASSIPNN